MKIPDNVSNDLKLAIEAAQEANSVITNALQTNIVAESKGAKGLVTEFDKKAEATIVETLRSASSYSIVGEESGLSDHQTEARWVVDPIDGTTNFSRGFPVFATSIALMRGHDTLVGVISNPANNELFFAERGQGAYCNGQKIQVSQTDEPTRAVVCLDRGYAEQDAWRMAEILRRLGSRYNVRILGATAIGLCTVAHGVTDAFICSGDELWDYAAGILLVQEAGGVFTDWHGHRWDGQHAFIFASNGPLHDLLLPEICDLQPE